MSTDNQSAVFNHFISAVKSEQKFWALQDRESEDWVVLDSVNFENTEAMPLWSSAALAEEHCVEEWQVYIPAEITVKEWLEFWLEDLKDDNIVLGINWPEQGACVEVDLAEFSQAIAEIETL